LIIEEARDLLFLYFNFTEQLQESQMFKILDPLYLYKFQCKKYFANNQKA
jgi:hypothetical protein